MAHTTQFAVAGFNSASGPSLCSLSSAFSSPPGAPSSSPTGASRVAGVSASRDVAPVGQRPLALAPSSAPAVAELASSPPEPVSPESFPPGAQPSGSAVSPSADKGLAPVGHGSLASAIPPAATFLSGFTSHPASPFHHGAAQPAPPRYSRPGPRLSRQEVIRRVKSSALLLPNIPGSKRRWLDQIDHLGKLGADSEFISSTAANIARGVDPGLFARPRPGSWPNSSSVDKNFPACKQRFDEYKVIRCLEKLSAPPKICHPLLAIVKPGKKPRLCLDLSRGFNEFVKKRRFKYLSLETAVECRGLPRVAGITSLICPHVSFLSLSRRKPRT